GSMTAALLLLPVALPFSSRTTATTALSTLSLHDALPISCHTSCHCTSRASCTSRTMAATMNRPVQTRRVRRQKRRAPRHAVRQAGRTVSIMARLLGIHGRLGGIHPLQAGRARRQAAGPGGKAMQHVEDRHAEPEPPQHALEPVLGDDLAAVALDQGFERVAQFGGERAVTHD